MSVNFCVPRCQCQSQKNKFGLCDDPPPANNKAHIDEKNGEKWIAVVVNEEKHNVKFTAIDNCIEIKRADGKMAKRCDGVLTYKNSIIFVELKERGALGSAWVKDAEKQLLTTINHFESSDSAEDFKKKKAYIANSEHPRFKSSQMKRMDKFLTETGYVLRIENRIILY